jgi:hypothetical protein
MPANAATMRGWCAPSAWLPTASAMLTPEVSMVASSCNARITSPLRSRPRRSLPPPSPERTSITDNPRRSSARAASRWLLARSMPSRLMP